MPAPNASASCCATTPPKLIFSCSGGADVGALADQTARQLTRDGVGKMYCLAGVGGRVDPILKTTTAATAILVIDGCQGGCGAACLRHAGITRFTHLRLTDFGHEKGKCQVTPEAITAMAKQATAIWATATV